MEKLKPNRQNYTDNVCNFQNIKLNMNEIKQNVQKKSKRMKRESQRKQTERKRDKMANGEEGRISETGNSCSQNETKKKIHS